MAIKLVRVRHSKTGAKTWLPETALKHLSAYKPMRAQLTRGEVPDGTAFTSTPEAPGEASSTPEAPDEASTSAQE